MAATSRSEDDQLSRLEAKLNDQRNSRRESYRELQLLGVELEKYGQKALNILEEKESSLRGSTSSRDASSMKNLLNALLQRSGYARKWREKQFEMLEASINLQQTDEALLDSKDKLTKAAQSLKKSSSALDELPGSKQLCGPTVSEITSAFKLICSNPQNVVSADIVISAIKNNRDMCSLLKVYKSEDKANAINRFNELLSERKNHGMDQDEVDFQCFLTVFFSEEAEVHWLLNNMPVSLHGKSINTPKEKLDQLHGSLKMKFDKQQEERQRLQWELESLDLKSVGQNLQKLLADTDEFEASKANALMLERRRLEQEHIDILSSKIREIELSIQDTKSKMKHELSRNKILRQTGARRKVSFDNL